MNFNANISDVVNAFLKEYYCSKKNCIDLSNLFSQYCICTLNNEEYCGYYNILKKYIEANIIRSCYSDLIYSHQIINNKLVLSVSGLWNGVSIYDTHTFTKHFNEVFVIGYDFNKFVVDNYILTIK